MPVQQGNAQGAGRRQYSHCLKHYWYSKQNSDSKIRGIYSPSFNSGNYLCTRALPHHIALPHRNVYVEHISWYKFGNSF